MSDLVWRRCFFFHSSSKHSWLVDKTVEFLRKINKVDIFIENFQIFIEIHHRLPNLHTNRLRFFSSADFKKKIGQGDICSQCFAWITSFVEQKIERLNWKAHFYKIQMWKFIYARTMTFSRLKKHEKFIVNHQPGYNCRIWKNPIPEMVNIIFWWWWVKYFKVLRRWLMD